MPCRDYSEDYSSQRIQETLNNYAQMLCSVLEFIEERNATQVIPDEPIHIEELDPKVQLWWQQHKERDKLRKEQEAKAARIKELEEDPTVAEYRQLKGWK